jgi:hypothetical protein
VAVVLSLLQWGARVLRRWMRKLNNTHLKRLVCYMYILFD